MYNSRYDTILSILQKVRTVSVTELKKRLDVSEVTIRKDLSILEEQGYLLRTHGGAQLSESPERNNKLPRRKERHIEEKKRIAQKALSLIRDNDTVYLDAGSTCALLAELLKDRNLRVVTNSLDVLLILADRPGIALHAIGGSYRMEAGSFIGPQALAAVSNFQIETCFIGTTGFTEKCIFTSMNVIESELKQHVLNISQRRVIVADHFKYGVTAFSVFARPKDIDVLITDGGFQDAERIRDNGIEVLFGQ